MVYKVVVILVFLSSILDAAVNPRLDFILAINPLFPADQQIYNVTTFYYNEDGMENYEDSLEYIRDKLDWMLGYSIGSKVGEITPANLGIRLQFEHFFNRYYDRYFDEYEGKMDSMPIDIYLLHFRGGLYALLKIGDLLQLEPEISFLFVRHQYKHHLIGDLKGLIFQYGVNNPGIITGLKLAYVKPKRVDAGAEIAFKVYGTITDLLIDPYITVSIIENLDCFVDMRYSFFTNAISPRIGVTVSVF